MRLIAIVLLTNSEPVEAEAADENAVATQGTHLASTQTVTHEYLTQSGKVMRETVTTLNWDGSIHDKANGIPVLTQKIIAWLSKNNRSTKIK